MAPELHYPHPAVSTRNHGATTMKKISIHAPALALTVLAADSLAAVEGGGLFSDSKTEVEETHNTENTNHNNSHNTDSSHSNNDQSYKNDVRSSYNTGNTATGTTGVTIQGPNQVVTTNYFKK
jgi:hypothetical protein